MNFTIAALESTEVRALVLALALALLCGVVIASLVFIAKAIRSVAGSMFKLHQQQANIIAMLLRAGFRPARGRDWFDDAHETKVKGDLSDTSFDWRQPE